MARSKITVYDLTKQERNVFIRYVLGYINLNQGAKELGWHRQRFTTLVANLWPGLFKNDLISLKGELDGEAKAIRFEAKKGSKS